MDDGWACAKCGAGNLFEDRFCGACGTPREAAPAPSSPAAKPAAAPLGDVRNAPASAAEGAPLVLAVGLAAALALGTLYHFVGRVFDLLILFPIILGVAVGLALKLAALKGRCRQAGVLIAAAVLSGAAAFGTRQVLDTLHVRGELSALLAAASKEAGNDEARDRLRLASESVGFSDALKVRADAGVGIGRARGGAKKKLNLSGTMFWVLMLVESGIVAFFAAAAVFPISRFPYCGRCRRFVPSAPIYRVNGRESDRLADAVRHQRWKEAQEMSDRATPSETDRAEATLLRCGMCRDSSIRVDLFEGRRHKRVMHVSVPPESLAALAKD
jgi:hypothetical protein